MALRLQVHREVLTEDFKTTDLEMTEVEKTIFVEVIVTVVADQEMVVGAAVGVAVEAAVLVVDVEVVVVEERTRKWERCNQSMIC